MVPVARRGRDAVALNGLLAGLRLALDRVLREVHGAEGCGTPDADAELLLGLGDWQGVALLARQHNVAGLFLHGLDGRPELAEAPVEDLRRFRSQRIIRAARLLRGLHEAANCLGTAGLPAIVLKGAPLSQRLYGHPWLRESVDVDMLVVPDALWAAERTLIGAGWRRPSENARGPRPGTAFPRYLKHSVLVGPDGPLELHRQLFANPLFLDAALGDLWARQETVQVGTASFAVLGEADDFLYGTCHGIQHGWRRLKWLCDAGVALGAAGRDPAALDRYRARFRSARMEAALESAALLCREHLHVRPPSSLCARRRAALVARRVGRGWAEPARSGPSGKLGNKAGAVLIGPGVRAGLEEVASVVAIRLVPWADRAPIKAARTFARVPVDTKAMALEAAFFLLAARLLVKHVRMARWRRWVVTGQGMDASADASGEKPLCPTTRPVPRKVGRVVARVAEFVPFEAVCLPQAMAAQWMLRRRGIGSRLFYGFRRRPGSDLELHAWLTTDGEGVVGYRDAQTYCIFPGFDDSPRQMEA